LALGQPSLLCDAGHKLGFGHGCAPPARRPRSGGSAAAPCSAQDSSHRLGQLDIEQQEIWLEGFHQAQRLGKEGKARQRLRESGVSFPKGFESADLQEAWRLVEGLSS
jgi:hypothetical protein